MAPRSQALLNNKWRTRQVNAAKLLRTNRLGVDHMITPSVSIPIGTERLGDEFRTRSSRKIRRIGGHHRLRIVNSESTNGMLGYELVLGLSYRINCGQPVNRRRTKDRDKEGKPCALPGPLKFTHRVALPPSIPCNSAHPPVSSLVTEQNRLPFNEQVSVFVREVTPA